MSKNGPACAHGPNRRNLRAFITTETELSAMAAPAKMEDSMKCPRQGCGHYELSHGGKVKGTADCAQRATNRLIAAAHPVPVGKRKLHAPGLPVKTKLGGARRVGHTRYIRRTRSRRVMLRGSTVDYGFRRR